LALDLLLRPVKDKTDGAIRVHRCCRRIVRELGVEWGTEGGLPPDGAVVSNHLSYLDILIYAAARPFVMVAKSEVSRWPIIGWITRQAGTVFVVRGGGPATYEVVNLAMAEAYRSGLPVLFFPEGTTTDGEEVLPFRRGLFHSVLNEGAALRSALITYSLGERDRKRGATVASDVCWWGDALLAPHLVRLAGMSGVQAQVRFGEVVTERRDRFELSESARDEVMQMFAELSDRSTQTVTCAQEAELVQAL
jgi:1-acyl-sn-glycerol-3-phosphate acyltransferase